VHARQGATCFNLDELPVKHWAMSMAQQHVLVVDHSKFGKVRPARMGDLGQFNVIVTNCRPDDETVALAKAQQIKVMY
jgi:DeoR family deoxyribose operon repressor